MESEDSDEEPEDPDDSAPSLTRGAVTALALAALPWVLAAGRFLLPVTSVAAGCLKGLVYRFSYASCSSSERCWCVAPRCWWRWSWSCRACCCHRRRRRRGHLRAYQLRHRFFANKVDDALGILPRHAQVARSFLCEIRCKRWIPDAKGRFEVENCPEEWWKMNMHGAPVTMRVGIIRPSQCYPLGAEHAPLLPTR